MKIGMVLLAVLVLAGLVVADYKWRRWMAARRREHEGDSCKRR